MGVKMRAVARQSLEEGLRVALRDAIAERAREEFAKLFSQGPFKEQLDRTVQEAMAEVVRSLDWGNGHPRVGFSRK